MTTSTTEPESMRGNALRDRPLSLVTSALTLVRDAALARALDPKNVAKGDWRDMSADRMLYLLYEEADELRDAIEAGEPLGRIMSEAGDVVWCVAMIVDVARKGER